jgi:hypothetical protein
MEYFPSKLVTAALLVPLTRTDTEGRPSPFAASVTVPDTVRCAKADTDRRAAATKARKDALRFISVNELLRLLQSRQNIHSTYSLHKKS